MDNVIKYLRIKLGAQIAKLKANFERQSERFRDNEFFLDFIKIIKKSSHTIEDINDLLLCYSDHELSLEEVLNLVKSGKIIYYDRESFGTAFPLNDFLLYFLLSCRDDEIILGTLKQFKTDDFLYDTNFDFAKYCSLNEFKTFYDIYYNLKNTINCEDALEQKKRKICFMYYLNNHSLFEPLNDIPISFDEFEKTIIGYENSGKTLDEEALKRLIFNIGSLNGVKMWNETLFKKVKKEYLDYLATHICFELSDFIDYYNKKFDDDFSVLFYNCSEKTLLNERILMLINSAWFLRLEIECGEYIDKFKSLEKSKNFLDKREREQSVNFSRECSSRKMVIERYGHLIEELKKPIKYTYNYFVYLNVLPEFRLAFRTLVSWYYDYGKIFDRDVRKSSKVQKEETFNAILEKCVDEIMGNLSEKAEITKKYLELINDCIEKKYIAVKKWREQVNSLLDFRIADLAEKHFTTIFQSLKNDNFSVVEYVAANGLNDIIFSIAMTLKSIKPSVTAMVDSVLETYEAEVRKIYEERQKAETEKETLSCSEIVCRFLEKDYKSKKDFLEVEGLTDAQFNSILKNVEANNFELYVKFMSRFGMLKSQRYALLMKMVDSVLAGLVNGVNENGTVRQFNFLDYSLLSKLPFDRFVTLVVHSNKLDNSNIRQFRRFEKLVRSYNMVTNEFIFTETRVVMLNGVPHEVTDEEKSLALAYLRQHNFSNYYVLYNLVLQKVLNGEITRDTLKIENGGYGLAKKNS